MKSQRYFMNSTKGTGKTNLEKTLSLVPCLCFSQTLKIKIQVQNTGILSCFGQYFC